ncbi:hypothetical protein ACOMHN_067055 [Nucella lapillus]
MTLPCNSCHPRHCVRSIPYSQSLRIRRNCSTDAAFCKRSQELCERLHRRGYPRTLLEAAVTKVTSIPRKETVLHRKGSVCTESPLCHHAQSQQPAPGQMAQEPHDRPALQSTVLMSVGTALFQAERLHDSGEVKMSDMVRLNAFSRLHDSIAPSIVGYCSTGEKLDVLCRFRVVIATCNTAGLLYTADLKAGHFTHAFIDEAGQATEPECLIPAGLVAGADGQVILAGDPHQLGPVLMSPLSKMYGLELSFLERLMDRLPYQHNNRQYHEHGGFQNTLVTMLVQNYRCHGAILQLPSELFYHGCLQECAPPAVTQALTSWPLLPRPGLPVVFHGVRSEDTREGDSPSWFNPGEVVEVVRYMQGLLGASPPVGPHDIGVITPYRKQGLLGASPPVGPHDIGVITPYRKQGLLGASPPVGPHDIGVITPYRKQGLLGASPPVGPHDIGVITPYRKQGLLGASPPVGPHDIGVITPYRKQGLLGASPPVGPHDIGVITPYRKQGLLGASPPVGPHDIGVITPYRKQGLLGASPPVGPHDIGVITPYRKQVGCVYRCGLCVQVEKVRMLTERLGMPRVKVGSVEEFQGQERRAVIISTVRSNERLVRSDVRHVLGFLSNAKRFNVAITRAQALLVVIGNPHVLVLAAMPIGTGDLLVDMGHHQAAMPIDTGDLLVDMGHHQAAMPIDTGDLLVDMGHHQAAMPIDTEDLLVDMGHHQAAMPIDTGDLLVDMGHHQAAMPIDTGDLLVDMGHHQAAMPIDTGDLLVDMGHHQAAMPIGTGDLLVDMGHHQAAMPIDTGDLLVDMGHHQAAMPIDTGDLLVDMGHHQAAMPIGTGDLLVDMGHHQAAMPIDTGDLVDMGHH